MLQSKKERLLEDQANMFAVSLLLPTELFEKEWIKLRRPPKSKKIDSEDECIKQIAKIFEVPEFAVTLKLMYLSQYGE